MSDTFFKFTDNSGLNSGRSSVPLLPDDDDDDDDLDGANEEEQYDALNNETFGGSQDDWEDWEKQHEEFAAEDFAMEASMSSLMDNDEDDDAAIESAGDMTNTKKTPSSNRSNDEGSNCLEQQGISLLSPSSLTSYGSSSIWAYTPPKSPITSTLHSTTKTFAEDRLDGQPLPQQQQKVPVKIKTVEELEKDLLQSSISKSEGTRIFPSTPPGFAPLNLHLYRNQPPLPHPSTTNVFGPIAPLSNTQPRLPFRANAPPGMHPRSHAGFMHPMSLRPPPSSSLQQSNTSHPGFQFNRMPPNVPQHFGRNPPPPGHPLHPNTNWNHNQLRTGFRPPPLMPPSLFSGGPMPHPGRPPLIGPHYMHGNYPPGLPCYNNPNKVGNPWGPFPHRLPINHMAPFMMGVRPAVGPPRDEYAGLMSIREKQWLLNIQMLQLNTGTPYFDDFYYTIYKLRKTRQQHQRNTNNNAILQNGLSKRGNHRKNDESSGGGGDSASSQMVSQRVYTPLQFENSLGKLQCGSVTAPRKLIDMDTLAVGGPVTGGAAGDVSSVHDTSSTCGSTILNSQQLQKESKRIKQALLELETMFSALLEAEDLVNPMAIENMKALREIRQKQRLKELDNATTTEQKQEILRQLKEESAQMKLMDEQCSNAAANKATMIEMLNRICVGFTRKGGATTTHSSSSTHNKLVQYMNVRKGKVLLLRLLPHLLYNFEACQSNLMSVWSGLLLHLWAMTRKDQADQLLCKFYEHFRRFVHHNCFGLTELQSLESELLLTKSSSSTSTTPAPVSSDCSSPAGVSTTVTATPSTTFCGLLTHSLGISAIAELMIRCEDLMSDVTFIEDKKMAKSRRDLMQTHRQFVQQFCASLDACLSNRKKLAEPIEPIPELIFREHCQRRLELDVNVYRRLHAVFVMDASSAVVATSNGS